MKRSMRAAFFAVAGLCACGAFAQMNPYHPEEVPPPAAKASHVQILVGPAPERVESDWAILRWTSNNPGGTDEHFAVAHLGTDPKHLDQTARSHIRLNRSHTETVFRVMVRGLKPNTTYYYTVDSVGADGTDDNVKSPQLQFTTPGPTTQGSTKQGSTTRGPA